MDAGNPRGFYERKGGKYGMAFDRHHPVLQGSTKMGADHGLSRGKNHVRFFQTTGSPKDERPASAVLRASGLLVMRGIPGGCFREKWSKGEGKGAAR